jgi:hypothetical protein
MAGKRKAGARTKSGRLSRAGRSDPRDMGTPEAQRKRQALVGPGNDTTLAASALGSLFAHGYIDQDQYDAGLDYRRLYMLIYGLPWPLNTDGGADLPEEEMMKMMAEIEHRFEKKVQRLTEEQRRVLGNVCVFEYRPNWFFCLRLNLKMLPEDLDEQRALFDGLRALCGMSKRKAA